MSLTRPRSSSLTVITDDDGLHLPHFVDQEAALNLIKDYIRECADFDSIPDSVVIFGYKRDLVVTIKRLDFTHQKALYDFLHDKLDRRHLFSPNRKIVKSQH